MRQIRVHVETEITDEEHLISNELKAFIIQNETEEYLPFKKVDQWKLSDVTKKVNAVMKNIETDDINKQTCYGSSPLSSGRSWSKERQKRREKRAMVQKKN